MRSLILVVVTIAMMAAFAAWGWWDFATPTIIETRSGTLAGFTIGETKREVMSQNAKSLVAPRPEALLEADTWDADVKVAECPERKRCPATTLQFEGDRLSAIVVRCHSCP